MNLTEGFKNQGPAIFLMWVWALILVYPDRGFIDATFGIIFVYFWVYFVHRVLHHIPLAVNTHMQFHHAGPDEKPLPRWLELVFETVTDAGMNMSLLLLQWLVGYHLVHPLIIVFFTLTYVSIHIINYSIIGSQTHRTHHLVLDKNFGPDTIDHIVGTNFDESFEDMTPLIFNGAVAFVIVGYIKDHIKLGA